MNTIYYLTIIIDIIEEIIFFDLIIKKKLKIIINILKYVEERKSQINKFINTKIQKR